MSGTIEIDDIIIVKLNDEFNENDIIVYEKNGDYITHRLIEKNSEYLITKGDANNNVDEAISENDVIGKVIYTIHNISIWKKVFLTPQIDIAIVISISLIWIIIRKQGKKDNDKKENK